MDRLPGYQAALEAAAFYLPPEPGTLHLQGEDRLAFLQRQTTNDVHQLAPGRSVVSVLVSPLARILDVFRLYLEGDGISMLTLPGYGAETFRYLKSRIFFMDKVTLSDQSAAWVHIDLEGPEAGRLLAELGLHAPAGLDEESESQELRLFAQRGLGHMGYRLLAPIQSVPGVLGALRSAGAEELSAESWQVLRLEAGMPAAGAEWVNEYTPLETGLEAAVAGDKGCYTGQEVIARQITYDKITQHLAGLKLEAPAQPGGRLYAEGKPVGTLTSAAVSPRFGPLGLAVVRRPYHQPGVRLTLEMPGDAGSQPAQVIPMPVSSASKAS